MTAVEEVLQQIGAQEISRILVFNKADALSPEMRSALQGRYREAVFVSALTGEGIDDLIARIVRVAAAQDEVMQLLVPYANGDMVSLAHERCFIMDERYEPEGVLLTLRVGKRLVAAFDPYRC